MRKRVLQLRAASDYHVHLRQGSMLMKVAKYCNQCGRIMVMPNTDPPILTAEDAKRYQSQIEKHLEEVDVKTTIKLVSTTTPQIIREAKEAGVLAVKLYPEGVTTNSEDGITKDIFKISYEAGCGKNCYPRFADSFMKVIEEIERVGLVLSIHCEMPGSEVLDREKDFLSFVNFIVNEFRSLRVVLEHISTMHAVNSIRSWQYLDKKEVVRIAGTITPHHLYLTLDDVVGDKIKPWNFCKPIVKSYRDRQALREAAFKGEPYFFLGSDSAPHARKHKEAVEGCAGVFNAPVLVESVIELFDRYGSFNNLQNFISIYGDSFYELETTHKSYAYERKPFKVEDEYDGIVPFLAGETLNWSLVE